MKEKLPNSISNEILAKYFAGEATAEEAARIDAWARESRENQELLLQLQIVWVDTGHVKSNVTGGKYDTNAAWKKVKAKKQAAESQKQSISWVWKVAASIVLVAGLAFLIRSFLEGPKQLTYTAESSISILELPDRSSVMLNEQSTLSYPETFQGNARHVKLQGEAFFEVEHNPDLPFIIEAGTTRIQVLGTSFNVKMDNGEVVVVVETGKVLFSSGAEAVILEAGKQGVFVPESKSIEVQDHKATIGVAEFWRTKTLKFSAHKLPEVVQALEKAYGVDIRLVGENLANCSLSVIFQDDSLENILDVIALTLDLEVKNLANEVILTGKGCAEQ